MTFYNDNDGFIPMDEVTSDEDATEAEEDEALEESDLADEVESGDAPAEETPAGSDTDESQVA